MNSGIEVFFTELNKPWSNADPGSMYHVNVFSPDGIEKQAVHAPNGYVSIDLPPGRYLVVGTHTSHHYVNFDSNETIVNVGCGQRVCVTIIPKSMHYCVWWLRTALQLMVEFPKLGPEVAKLAPAAIKALEPLENAIPKEYHQFEHAPKSLEGVKKTVKEYAAKLK